MSSNLRLTGQQATLTVHSMLSRTNGHNANKAGEKVNVVVKVAEKSPPKSHRNKRNQNSIGLIFYSKKLWIEKHNNID